MVLLFILDWSETYYVDQATLKLTKIHMLLPPECGIKVMYHCTTVL